MPEIILSVHHFFSFTVSRLSIVLYFLTLKCCFLVNIVNATGKQTMFSTKSHPGTEKIITCLHEF